MGLLGQPRQVEASQSDIGVSPVTVAFNFWSGFSTFIKAKYRSVRQHSKVAIGTGSVFQELLHGPGKSTVSAEFDRDIMPIRVLALGCVWVREQ